MTITTVQRRVTAIVSLKLMGALLHFDSCRDARNGSHGHWEICQGGDEVG